MIHNKIPGVEDYLSEPGKRGYIGFDPTAPSLTIGNFVQIMILSFFKKSGHQPIVMMGGATGRIGDPSGKDKERQLLDTDTIEKNLQCQVEQARKLLSFDEGPEAIFVNNYDFYKDMNVLTYLRDIGKTLTVNYMLSKDSVKNRLDSGISYTEFSYQILQGYDFLELYRSYDCALQMGGSDQWGNITSGTEFIRRSESDAQAFAVTTPLLTKSDGAKFGKSEGGNIWLDPDMTTPYQFYQFWINADDADLPKLFRYFSFKNREEIESLESSTDNPNELKRLLAEELTSRVHSPEASQSARKVSEILFNRKLDEDMIRSFDATVFEQVSKEIDCYDANLPVIGANLVDVLTEHTEAMSSKSEVYRAIKGNALSINKVKVSSNERQISDSDLLQGKYLFMENGKKHKFLIRTSGR